MLLSQQCNTQNVFLVNTNMIYSAALIIEEMKQCSLEMHLLYKSTHLPHATELQKCHISTANQTHTWWTIKSLLFTLKLGCPWFEVLFLLVTPHLILSRIMVFYSPGQLRHVLPSNTVWIDCMTLDSTALSFCPYPHLQAILYLMHLLLYNSELYASSRATISCLL